MERDEFSQPLQSTFDRPFVGPHAYASGVSWGAVIAGAFVTAALALILLALGTGLGLSAVSPWSNVGASASSVGKGAILWLILMEIMASSMGGYLAGRLRTKWTRIHGDEVYFRDTAHGFLAWCVALVITVAFLASGAASMAGRGASRGNESSARAISPTDIDLSEYFADMLLRSTAPNSDNLSTRREVELILANGLREGGLQGGDQTYLAQLVAARTGLSEASAQERLAGVLMGYQQAVETARKSVAHSLLWIFLALLIGAFCASVSATWGGSQRDHVVVV